MRWLVFLCFLSLNSIADNVDWFSPCPISNGYVFKSDFNNAFISNEETGSHAYLFVSKPESCPDKTPDALSKSFGSVLLQYQGGNLSQRSAKPLFFSKDRGSVLEFSLKQANLSDKIRGRVQLIFFRMTANKAMRIRVKVYFPSSMKHLQSLGKDLNWLVVSEWWNDPDWDGSKFPFRISTNVINNEKAPGLSLEVTAETKSPSANKWDSTVWSRRAEGFIIPYDRWINLEYVVVEGNKESGRFVFSASIGGEKLIKYIDVSNFTHHPLDKNPNGFADFHPLKLYTSKQVIQHMEKLGGLRLLWDDIEIDSCDVALCWEN